MFCRRFLPIVLTVLSVPAFAEENTLTAEEQAAGWKLLFDGKAAPGLRGLQKRDFLKAGWVIEDGALGLPKTVRESGKVTGGDLVTAEQFGDFEFRFEFRLAASALSGILYFARGSAGGSPTGHEYQIIDDVHHPDGLRGGPTHRTAALYGVIAPVEGTHVLMDERPDEIVWNRGAIVVQGNHVEHWLNGKLVLQYDCGSKELMAAARASKAAVPATFGTKIKSSLAILDKGEEVWLRNLKIRSGIAPPTAPLSAPGTPAATPAPVVAATPPPRPIAVAATPPPATPAPASTWKLPPLPPPPVLKP
jgi:hypothetical protein